MRLGNKNDYWQENNCRIYLTGLINISNLCYSNFLVKPQLVKTLVKKKHIPIAPKQVNSWAQFYAVVRFTYALIEANQNRNELISMASKDRFATELTKDDIMQAIQSRIPKKTLQTTKWAYGIWNSWCKIRFELTQMTVSRMNELLTQFIMEARSQDIEVYPPKTLLLYNAI